MFEFYTIIAVICLILGLFFTILNMIDYYDEKEGYDPSLKGLENSRKFVRISFIGTLLSPVWPVIFPILVVIGFIKVSRVVMEID